MLIILSQWSTLKWCLTSSSLDSASSIVLRLWGQSKVFSVSHLYYENSNFLPCLNDRVIEKIKIRKYIKGNVYLNNILIAIFLHRLFFSIIWFSHIHDFFHYYDIKCTKVSNCASSFTAKNWVKIKYIFSQPEDLSCPTIKGKF